MSRRLLFSVALSLATLFSYALIWLEKDESKFRPYVYRQFVPLLSGGNRIAATIIIMLCAIGFVVGMWFLLKSYLNNEWKIALSVIVASEVLALMAVFPPHIYDIPTAMFFTVSLALFARRKFIPYLILFPFACLNRETTILLTVLFAVFFFGRLEKKAYLILLVSQIIIYAVVFLAVRIAFRDTPGREFFDALLYNLRIYASVPVLTAILVDVFLAVFLVVNHKWERAPYLMRTAFLVFAPILTIMYLFIGVSFEVRVFIELLPVIIVIATS